MLHKCIEEILYSEERNLMNMYNWTKCIIHKVIHNTQILKVALGWIHPNCQIDMIGVLCSLPEYIRELLIFATNSKKRWSSVIKNWTCGTHANSKMMWSGCSNSMKFCAFVLCCLSTLSVLRRHHYKSPFFHRYCNCYLYKHIKYYVSELFIIIYCYSTAIHFKNPQYVHIKNS